MKNFWSPSDDVLLKSMLENKKTYTEISKILSRTVSAIRSRASRLGLINLNYISHNDLTGKKFNKLNVLERIDPDKWGCAMWKCVCDCQLNKPEEEWEYTYVRGQSLKDGNTKSCGCLNHVKGIDSPFKKFNEYKTWEDVTFVKFSNCNEWFICDTEDWKNLKDHCWHKNTYGYAISIIGGHNTRMHRLIMNAPDNMTVDHRKRVSEDGVCDNRKKNLRICSNKENCRNRGRYKTSSNEIIGVTWKKDLNKWESRIMVDYKSIVLGYFEDNNYDDAIRARLLAEQKYFGEFAPQKHLYEQYGVLSNVA